MKSPSAVITLVVTVLLVGAFAAAADDAEDRVAQRVEVAEERFEKAVRYKT